MAVCLCLYLCRGLFMGICVWVFMCAIQGNKVIGQWILLNIIYKQILRQ